MNGQIYLRNPRWIGVAWVGLLAFILTSQVIPLWEERATYQVLDTFFSWRGPRSATDEKVRIILVDDESLKGLGGKPLSHREKYGKLLKILNTLEFRPKVLGFDIAFLDSDAFDEELLKSTQEASFPVVYGVPLEPKPELKEDWYVSN